MLTSADRRVLLRPLPENPFAHAYRHVMLGASAAVHQLDGLREQTIMRVDLDTPDMRDTVQAPPAVMRLYVETLAQMTSIFPREKIDTVSIEVSYLRRDYGERLLYDTVHVDIGRNEVRRQKKKQREFSLVMGAPFTPIIFPRMTVEEAIMHRAANRRVGYNDVKLGPQATTPLPGQYVLLQEMTGHTAADVSDIKSYEQAQARYGTYPDMMRMFDKSGFRRLLVYSTVRLNLD